MKTIYAYKITSTLNEDRVSETTNWFYGEMPEREVKNLSLEEALEYQEFISEKRLFSKKRHLRLRWSEYWYNEERFKSASIIWEPFPIKSSYSISDLAKNLDAESFVRWCKDRGINEIKI